MGENYFESIALLKNFYEHKNVGEVYKQVCKLYLNW